MVPEKASYTSRFALKFAEILGAGLATAVSGYLVAHLGGYLPWPNKPPAPTAAVEALPSGSTKTPERPSSHAAAPAPAEADSHTAAAHDTRAKEPAAAKAAEVSAPTTAAAATSADNDEKRSRGASASRKPVSEQRPAKPAPRESTEAKAHETPDAKPRENADAKPHDNAETKARETSEAKTREEEAVEEQVRAALANVDATRTPPAPPLTPPPATATPLPQTSATPQPPIAPTNPAATATAPAATSTIPPSALPSAAPAQPLDTQNAAAVAATVPSAPVIVPPAQAPATEPGPLTTVEIKPRPVAGVGETSAAAAAQADNEPDGKTKEASKGFFSAITHLPDMLRADAHGPGNEPPRPPMPVGQ